VAKTDERETFAHILREVRELSGLTQPELAEALGVSTKTISRWELGEVLPGRLQHHALVTCIGALAPTHTERAAAVFGKTVVSLPVEAPQEPRPNMAILKAALDGALFEAVEKLGAPPATVREAMVIVLERVALLGVDAKTAAKLVAGKVG
jgi:hypothetical protein